MIKMQYGLVLVLLISSLLFAGTGVPLPEVVNPIAITADSGQIYITQTDSVCIYSLKDFKFIKKFGRRGEGPGEFKFSHDMPLCVNVRENEIVVRSVGRLTFFGTDGTYKKLVKTPPVFIWAMQPAGESYVGVSSVQEGKGFLTFNLFNEKLEKVKELFRVPEEIRMEGKGFKFFFLQVPTSVPTSFAVDEDKVFLSWGNDTEIKVFDKTGKRLAGIIVPGSKMELTAAFKEQVIETYKNDKSIPAPIYQRMYKNIVFPGYLPPVRDLRAADGKLYVLTYRKKENKIQCLIYNRTGNLIKQTYLPLKNQDPLRHYPFTIRNDKLYQLIENFEQETFFLDITSIN